LLRESRGPWLGSNLGPLAWKYPGAPGLEVTQQKKTKINTQINKTSEKHIKNTNQQTKISKIYQTLPIGPNS